MGGERKDTPSVITLLRAFSGESRGDLDFSPYWSVYAAAGRGILVSAQALRGRIFRLPHYGRIARRSCDAFFRKYPFGRLVLWKVGVSYCHLFKFLQKNFRPTGADDGSKRIRLSTNAAAELRPSLHRTRIGVTLGSHLPDAEVGDFHSLS